MTQLRLAKKREELIQAELAECSFHPKINIDTSTLTPRLISTKTAYSTERRQQSRQKRLDRAVQMQQQKEQSTLQECTFHPRISPNTKEILSNVVLRKEKQQRVEQLKRHSTKKKRHHSKQIAASTKSTHQRYSSVKPPPPPPARAPPAPPAPAPPNLIQLEQIFACSWEGILSHQYGYNRPKPHLLDQHATTTTATTTQPSSTATPLQLLHTQVVRALENNKAMQNDSNDDYIRQESQRCCSSLHEYIHTTHQMVDSKEQRHRQHQQIIKNARLAKKYKEQQDRIDGLQQERTAIFRQLLLYYRERMKREGYSYNADEDEKNELEV